MTDRWLEHPSTGSATDAIIRVTSSGICGSDLHLCSGLGAFIDEGDILGHEPMGILEAVGAEGKGIAPGDRVSPTDRPTTASSTGARPARCR